MGFVKKKDGTSYYVLGICLVIISAVMVLVNLKKPSVQDESKLEMVTGSLKNIEFKQESRSLKIVMLDVVTSGGVIRMESTLFKKTFRRLRVGDNLQLKISQFFSGMDKKNTRWVVYELRRDGTILFSVEDTVKELNRKRRMLFLTAAVILVLGLFFTWAGKKARFADL